MKRSLVIVIAVLLAGLGLFAGSYFVGQRACRACVGRTADSLEWLRDEFHLSDADMARVRELHEGYMPKCMEMCAQIAAKKKELDTELAGATNISAGAKQKLTELAVLRSQCQAQMLEHFVQVSRAMPPEQGRRYLSEMERLTIGSHEQTEQTMSDHSGHMHGDH
jgi:hypothetical protein